MLHNGALPAMFLTCAKFVCRKSFFEASCIHGIGYHSRANQNISNSVTACKTMLFITFCIHVECTKWPFLMVLTEE